MSPNPNSDPHSDSYSTLPNTLPQFLWHFAKRYKLYLLGLIFSMSYWAAQLSLIPYTIKLIIDQVSKWDHEGSLFSFISFPILFYFVLSLFIGVVFRCYDYCRLKTFPDMEAKISEELFEYTEKHSYSYFQNNFAGSLGNKVKEVSKGCGKILNQLIEIFLGRFLALMIGMITLFFIHPYFAYVLGVWSIIFLTASMMLSTRAQHYSKLYSESRSTVVGKIVDSIGNILNVKLFAREPYEVDYLRRYLNKSANIARQGEWYLLKVKTFYTVSINLLTLMMILLLIRERANDLITVGDFALVLMLHMSLIDQVWFLANQLVPFSEDVGTCQQALSILSVPRDILDAPDAKPLQITKGEIVFDQVHFQYKKGHPVFVNTCLTIRPGERVGLVGFSGSGKSTFVNLLLRFFDIDSGKITIDGQDIKHVTQASLRSQIAMIPQDPSLFHRSLTENIGYGKIGATEETIIACSKQAHCHAFIEKSQEGYESRVGERGVKLSGGQRQRIAIARAILKDAPILVLDEATSSLDSITEHYIQDSLNHLMEGRTTIVIAHRLSTLFHMDRILVFHEGAVIEDGNHTELLARDGHYAKLWSMQAGGFVCCD